jgi:DNA-directed RNA polymerase subunit E"
MEKACRTCRVILAQGGETCPICGSTSLTSKWSGYIVVLNVDTSDLAKKLNLKANGTYALNIND